MSLPTLDVLVLHSYDPFTPMPHSHLDHTVICLSAAPQSRQEENSGGDVCLLCALSPFVSVNLYLSTCLCSLTSNPVSQPRLHLEEIRRVSGAREFDDHGSARTQEDSPLQ